jgi:hypothetical protein
MQWIMERWHENLDGSTQVMILIQIEPSYINKIFEAKHYNKRHDFRKKNLNIVSYFSELKQISYEFFYNFLYFL